MAAAASPPPSPSWSVSFIEDPSSTFFLHRQQQRKRTGGSSSKRSRRQRPRSASVTDSLRRTDIVHVEIPIDDILSGGGAVGADDASEARIRAFRDEGGRVARVALADYASRLLDGGGGGIGDLLSAPARAPRYAFRLEKLDRHVHGHRHQFRSSSSSTANAGGNGGGSQAGDSPFIMERTDIWCDGDRGGKEEPRCLHLFLRVLAYSADVLADAGEQQREHQPTSTRMALDDNVDDGDIDDEDEKQYRECCRSAVLELLRRSLFADTGGSSDDDRLMNHVATAVLQDRLRKELTDDDSRCGAVAFVADGSILPRKSGASSLPMSTPPAVPFRAPTGIQVGGVGGGDSSATSSCMSQTVQVEMGKLRRYLRNLPSTDTGSSGSSDSGTVVALSGLVVPRGVTLIVGGGYHGKSTLLRCIACGVYNKVPGDGREFCVTVNDAVSVRAEDVSSSAASFFERFSWMQQPPDIICILTAAFCY